MRVLRVCFSAYNRKMNHFAQCFIMIQKNMFSVSKIYKISVAKEYFICSEIKIDELIDQLCEKETGDFLNAYHLAKDKGFSFTAFPDFGNINMSFYRVPRFGEADFERIINSIGGYKVPETITRTPDFNINDILLEFKDLQQESLENKERQKSIAKLFENRNDYVINIDPFIDFGDLTYGYHRLIKNTIKNQFKSASDQIKQYQTKENFRNAGIVLFNTGLYSLPHELLKEMVTDILNRETKIIEFAFIFSQKMQTNGWDMHAVFASEWIGKIPNELEKIKGKMDQLVNTKMAELIRKNDSLKIIESQKPISFEIDNKVFFWNPGQIRFPWEEK